MAPILYGFVRTRRFYGSYFGEPKVNRRSDYREPLGGVRYIFTNVRIVGIPVIQNVELMDGSIVQKRPGVPIELPGAK